MPMETVTIAAVAAETIATITGSFEIAYELSIVIKTTMPTKTGSSILFHSADFTPTLFNPIIN